MTDKAKSESFRINLPKELRAAAMGDPRRNADRFLIEGWRNSWFTRVCELFVGKD